MLDFVSIHESVPFRRLLNEGALFITVNKGFTPISDTETYVLDKAHNWQTAATLSSHYYDVQQGYWYTGDLASFGDVFTW